MMMMMMMMMMMITKHHIAHIKNSLLCLSNVNFTRYNHYVNEKGNTINVDNKISVVFRNIDVYQ